MIWWQTSHGYAGKKNTLLVPCDPFQQFLLLYDGTTASNRTCLLDAMGFCWLNVFFAALQMCECNCYRPVMVWVVWQCFVTNIPWLCRQEKHFACSLRPVSAVSPTLKRYYSKQQDMFVGWHGLLLIELFAALQMCECNCYRPVMVWVVWHDLVTNIPWLCRQEKHFACSLRPV